MPLVLSALVWRFHHRSLDNVLMLQINLWLIPYALLLLRLKQCTYHQRGSKEKQECSDRLRQIAITSECQHVPFERRGPRGTERLKCMPAHYVQFVWRYVFVSATVAGSLTRHVAPLFTPKWTHSDNNNSRRVRMIQLARHVWTAPGRVGSF